MHKIFSMICHPDHICLSFIDFMMLWLHGENGTGPAKFNIPHSVTVDSSGRVKIQCHCIWNCVSEDVCMCLSVHMDLNAPVHVWTSGYVCIL